MNKHKSTTSNSKHLPRHRNIPTREASETLLDFAQPLLDMLDHCPSPEEIRGSFIYPLTAWNAVVLEQLGQGSHHLEGARSALMPLSPPVALALFDSLVERKRKLFAEDLRFILLTDVAVDPDGSLRIHAEARGHESLRTRPG